MKSRQEIMETAREANANELLRLILDVLVDLRDYKEEQAQLARRVM